MKPLKGWSVSWNTLLDLTKKGVKMIESYSRKAVLAEIRMELEQAERTIELVTDKIAQWRDDYLDGKIGKRYEAKKEPDIESNLISGDVIVSSAKEGLVIKCGNGAVRILRLQAPNGKILDAKSFLNGRKFWKQVY